MSQQLSSNEDAQPSASLSGESDKESDNEFHKESDEESEHSAEILPMTQRERNREAKRESMLRYVQKWDDLEQAALKFEQIPTKRKLSPKELRQIQKEKKIRQRQREIKEGTVAKAMQKEYIKTMDKLKKKYEEASKRPPRTGKQRYDPKVARIYDQVIEAKHKKADKKAKEWAPLIGMESEQSNIIKNINRVKQGSHLNDVIFCDSRRSSVDSMIERNERYLKEMKHRFPNEEVDDDSDEDEVEKDPRYLEYLLAKKEHMQKAANKIKRGNDFKKMEQEYDGMMNASREDLHAELQQLEDEIEEDVMRATCAKIKESFTDLLNEKLEELDEINEKIKHLETTPREYENKQMNAANIGKSSQQKERFTALNQISEDFEMKESFTDLLNDRLERQCTANMTACKAKFEKLEKLFRKQNDILQDEIAQKTALERKHKNSLNEMRDQKRLRKEKLNDEERYLRVDTNGQRQKKEKNVNFDDIPVTIGGDSVNEISEKVEIIGDDRLHKKRLYANSEYLSVGKKRFYYKDIKRLVACSGSETKWLILTNECTIRIKSKSAKARQKLMAFIQSNL